MSWIAAGVALVGTAASMSASDKQAGAIDDAAEAGAAGSRYAANVQKQIFDQTRKDQTPWRDVGEGSLNRLAMLMGIPGASGGGFSPYREITASDLMTGDFEQNQDLYAKSPEYRQAWDAAMASHRAKYGLAPMQSMGSDAGQWTSGIASAMNLDAYNAQQKALAEQRSETASQDPEFGTLTKQFSLADFQADPGYAFRQTEDQKAIERSAAARGGLLSGSALKAIQNRSQDLASQEYGNAYNRFNANQTNQFNRLSSLAGVGQVANNALQTAGQNYAGSVGQIAMNNAANQGNALLAGGNARASGYAGIGNALSSAAGLYGMMQGGGFGGGAPAGAGAGGQGYFGGLSSSGFR